MAGRYGLDDRTQPNVRAVAESVGGMFGVPQVLGYGQRSTPNSDHPKGLALDFMVGTDRGMGDSVAQYLQRNAAALGVTYIIWRQHIWNIERSGEGWRLMGDRGGITENHFDHVHCSFRPGKTSPTMPSIPAGTGDGSTSVDPAAVRAILLPGPDWFGDQLKNQLDEDGAAMVKAVTGLVIAAVIVLGGVGLVMAGLARSAQSQPPKDDQ